MGTGDDEPNEIAMKKIDWTAVVATIAAVFCAVGLFWLMTAYFAKVEAISETLEREATETVREQLQAELNQLGDETGIYVIVY